jgi:hypothetical protein
VRGEDCEIYFVSYDSDITNEEKLIIRNLLSEEIGGGSITGEPNNFFFAVMWRELERRARLFAELLLPLLTGFPRGPGSRPWVFSASLGSLLFAHLAQRHVETAEGDRPFSQWWSFAPAIPAHGFTPSGGYEKAPEALYSEPHRIFYSRSDLVLLVAYCAANNHFAMGTTGPLAAPSNFVEKDTTMITGETHPYVIVPPGDYFNLLGSTIRNYLGKPDKA